jgi:SAM-dependent methyltransferase
LPGIENQVAWRFHSYIKQDLELGEKIFEEWRVYEKLLIHDYMDHAMFFGRLQQGVSQKFHRPISVLDLGCGDLTPILPLLQSIPLQRYVGIDESKGALAIAAERLAERKLPGELIHGDLRDTLQTLQEKFDLVVASFSLHHLADPDDKLHTLKAIEQHLTGEGMFALIDVFCDDDEPRSEYVERWITHADRHYEELQQEEKQLLFDHVRARDNPASENQWRSMGKLANLGQFAVLEQDAFRLNGLVTFSRAAAW